MSVLLIQGEKSTPSGPQGNTDTKGSCVPLRGLAGGGGAQVCVGAALCVFFSFFAVLIHYVLPFKCAYHV